MASGNKQENERLEREKKKLEIKMNIHRHEGFLSNGLNTRRLRTTRAIPLSHPVVLPISSSVQLERLDRLDNLADNEESDLGFMNPAKNQTHMKKHVIFELDTDQGEGKTKKVKFAARQLNDKIQLHISGVSDKYSELTTTSEHDQTLVNK